MRVPEGEIKADSCGQPDKRTKPTKTRSVLQESFSGYRVFTGLNGGSEPIEGHGQADTVLGHRLRAVGGNAGNLHPPRPHPSQLRLQEVAVCHQPRDEIVFNA